MVEAHYVARPGSSLTFAFLTVKLARPGTVRKANVKKFEFIGVSGKSGWARAAAARAAAARARAVAATETAAAGWAASAARAAAGAVAETHCRQRPQALRECC